jgi:2-methylisocitrate lyase-like PEP mutase family enzyme
MTSAGKKLREIFKNQKLVVTLGAYDAFSAMLIEQAGFPIVYMSGGCVTHSMIGKPDIGYLSQAEMIRSVRNIVSAINVPLVADGDNGYGGPLQVMRTVEEYIVAGAAAIQMEDQVMPKRCGFMSGKQLVSKEEAVAKIKVASYIRDKLDPNFVIIARTDAVGVYGIEEAISRANAFYEAGADVIYVEAPVSKEMMETITKRVTCKWLMSIYVEGGVTPMLSPAELEELGFKFVIHPAALIFVVAKAMREMLSQFKKDNYNINCKDMMLDFDKVNEIVKLDVIRALEKSFSQ